MDSFQVSRSLILGLVRPMRVFFGAAIAAAGILSGCATNDGGPEQARWYEYDVEHPSHRDISRVRRLLHDVAAEAEIPRHYGGDYSPWPIAGYMADDVFLDAVVEHGQLRILLQREHSPPTAAFTRVKDVLERALAKTFGSRAVAQPVVVPHTVIAY
jgi:hypothetical protein